MKKEFKTCECECDECRGNCTNIEGHHDMEKEFNLSDYRIEPNIYLEHVIKEFIKRLKKEAELDKIDRDIVDKLAGDKLI